MQHLVSGAQKFSAGLARRLRSYSGGEETGEKFGVPVRFSRLSRSGCEVNLWLTRAFRPPTITKQIFKIGRLQMKDEAKR